MYALLALLLPTFFLFRLNGQMVCFGKRSRCEEHLGIRNNLTGQSGGSACKDSSRCFILANRLRYGSPRIAGQMISAEPVWSTLLGDGCWPGILVWLARHFFIRRPVEKTGLRGTRKILWVHPDLAFDLRYLLIPIVPSGPGLAAIPVSTAAAIGIGLAAAVFLGLASAAPAHSRRVERPAGFSGI